MLLNRLLRSITLLAAQADTAQQKKVCSIQVSSLWYLGGAPHLIFNASAKKNSCPNTPPSSRPRWARESTICGTSTRSSRRPNAKVRAGPIHCAVYWALKPELKHPQGHGYAAAVLGSVTALVSGDSRHPRCRATVDGWILKADAQSRATWLTSSNVLNRRFYNSQGFYTVGSVTLGEGDADWREGPVVVDLVSGIWIVVF